MVLRTNVSRHTGSDTVWSAQMNHDCLGGKWQGHQGSNPGPTVLETVALPTELYPYTVREWIREAG